MRPCCRIISDSKPSSDPRRCGVYCGSFLAEASVIERPLSPQVREVRLPKIAPLGSRVVFNSSYFCVPTVIKRLGSAATPVPAAVILNWTAPILVSTSPKMGSAPRIGSKALPSIASSVVPQQRDSVGVPTAPAG
uniref:Uncharacterized protein n=1 Tax=Fagus sylvatica TaxID=28930 RepID=A0A2N9HN34_FAGSY